MMFNKILFVTGKYITENKLNSKRMGKEVMVHSYYGIKQLNWTRTMYYWRWLQKKASCKSIYTD